MKTSFNIKALGKVVAKPTALPGVIAPADQPIVEAERTDIEPYDWEREFRNGVRSIYGTTMVLPLKMKLRTDNNNDWFVFPTEPIITLGGSNNIVKRNVAKGKGKGTIKERWSQDDYSITIDVLLQEKNSSKYPEQTLRQLMRICEGKTSIDVECPLFEYVGITKMVIESWEIPHTVGEELQLIKISAVSDWDWDLFIDIDDKKNNAL